MTNLVIFHRSWLVAMCPIQFPKFECKVTVNVNRKCLNFISEMSDIILKTQRSDQDKALMQEKNDVTEFLRIQRNKYIKLKIWCDTIHDCLENNSLDAELRAKVRDIFIEQSCLQIVDLKGYTQGSSVLLGLTDLNQTELTHNESAKLQRCVETAVKEKYNSICDYFRKLTDQDINEALKDELNENASLELKRKLLEQKRLYIDNLQKKQEVLDDFAKLRLEKVPVVCSEKIAESKLKSKLNFLSVKLIKEKSRIDTFMESDETFNAFKEVMKDIKEQQQQYESDIKHLKKLREKYKQVACKQYSELLKSYIQYKSILEKKKLMYEALKR